jgi:hypothetical protein
MFWAGENHNVSVGAVAIGAKRRHWPLGLGYDRFHAVIGGETSQWHPELIEDSDCVEQLYLPEDGYHFSKDIAYQASASFVTPSSRVRTSRGIAGTGPAPIMRLITHRRSTSKNTRAVRRSPRSASERVPKRMIEDASCRGGTIAHRRAQLPHEGFRPDGRRKRGASSLCEDIRGRVEACRAPSRSFWQALRRRPKPGLRSNE